MKRTITKFKLPIRLKCRALFAIPRLAFGDEFEPDPVIENSSPDDTPPDFGTLGKADEPAASSEQQTDPNAGALSEVEAGVKTTEQKQAEDDEAKRKEEEQAEAARKAEAEKKGAKEPTDEEKQKAVKDAEDKAKATKDAEDAAKKAAEGKTPENDDDLDALQPPKGASEKSVTDFNNMRGIMKVERARSRALEVKLSESAKAIEDAKKAGENATIPEEVQNELRELRARVGAEDPVVMKEFNERLTKSQDSLVSELKALGLGSKLSKEEQEEFFGKELWEQDAAWWQEKVLDKLGKDFITSERIKAQLVARDNALRDRTAKAKEIQGNPGEWETRQKADAEAKSKEFTTALQDEVATRQKDKEWANFKQLAGTETPEQKAAIEAHNAKVKSGTDRFREDVLAVYHRDPRAIGRVVLSAHEADVLKEQVTGLQAEIAELKKLNAEHEELIAAANKAGSISRRTSDTVPALKKDAKKGEVEIGETGEMLEPDFSTLGRRS